METSSTTTSEGTAGSGCLDPPRVLGMQGRGDLDSRYTQVYKGQLKLAVYVNFGHLTVHVIQGRHLQPKKTTLSNTVVQLCLAPDVNNRTYCKTELVAESSSPLYDEKFSFELLNEDKSKRLYISVWNTSSENLSSAEFLGSMSFGLKHIQSEKRVINGWYYLLCDDIGRRKHLQAIPKATQLKERVMNVGITPVNQDIMWMDSHVLLLKKSRSAGYGFTVVGSCPVQVSRVEPGSPACISGLQVDDFVVRVGSTNVSRSTSDSVAKLIRSTGKQMVLEIQRPHQNSLHSSIPSREQSTARDFRPPQHASTPMTSNSVDDVHFQQPNPLHNNNAALTCSSRNVSDSTEQIQNSRTSSKATSIHALREKLPRLNSVKLASYLFDAYDPSLSPDKQNWNVHNGSTSSEPIYMNDFYHPARLVNRGVEGEDGMHHAPLRQSSMRTEIWVDADPWSMAQCEKTRHQVNAMTLPHPRKVSVDDFGY